MKTFEVKAVGLEELRQEELRQINGGLPKWISDLLPGGVVVTLWVWINEHWDAFVEGLEEGAEEGQRRYGDVF